MHHVFLYVSPVKNTSMRHVTQMNESRRTYDADIHICTHICTYIYKDELFDTYIYKDEDTYVYICTKTRIHMYTYADTYIYKDEDTYVYMCA